MVPKNSTPGGFAYIWQSKWVGIIAIKTEKKQIHFLSDVVIAVASLDLKVPIAFWWLGNRGNRELLNSKHKFCQTNCVWKKVQQMLGLIQKLSSRVVTFTRWKKFFVCFYGTSSFLSQKYAPHCLKGEELKNFIRDTHAQSLSWWKIEATMKGFFLPLSIVLFFAGISSHGIDEKTPLKGTIRFHVFGICETAFVLLPIFIII